MPAENQQHRFIISPAKSILIFDLSMAAIILLVLLASPIISSVKIIAACLLVCYAIVTIRSFQQAVINEVQYLASSKQWLHNGQLVSLRQQQFVTRDIVILYFLTEKGKNTSQVIAYDSMPEKQHIQLRKLLIAWSKTASRDE